MTAVSAYVFVVTGYLAVQDPRKRTKEHKNVDFRFSRFKIDIILTNLIEVVYDKKKRVIESRVMIKFEGVTKAYGGEAILEDLSFKVNKGEKCGLVGRNGSGKTTLLRMITQEESPDKGAIDVPKSYSIGYLTQHLHFTKNTLIEEAALALRPEDSDQLHKVEKILFGLGFKEEDLHTPPNQFSGGYQLRIHLAKVLAQEPDCLLLDEPTNYLDIVSIRWFTRFLSAWSGELILISHDRDFMDHVTTHTLGIHRKKVRKLEGGTEKFYSQLLHEEHIHERTRVNLEKKRAHMETFITKLGAKASKASQAQSRKKALARMPVLEELAALHHLDFKFPYSPFPGHKLIDVEHVYFAYEKMSSPLIQDLNLTIEKNDRIAVIGKNGRGKSTILRLLAQDIEPAQGKIKVASNARIGFFGQTNIERLDPKRTIEEEISSASPYLSISEVRRICGVMLFSGDTAKKPIGVLSGGEKSRVLLGKILVSPCNLLLLDEPTNHLDMESIEALVGALEEFEGAVVIVTHSEMILRQLPSKFVICHQGNQHLFEGDYDEFLEKEGWDAKAVKGTEKIKPPDDRRESKRKRAELVNSRSRTLQPLQKKIDQIEKEIMHLEVEVEKEVHMLIEASQQGDGNAISNLSKNIDDKKKKIEALFSDLEILIHDIEEKNAEFDKLLSFE